MNHRDALQQLNTFFVYTQDQTQYGRKFEIYRILDRRHPFGDCEDYALTLFWLMSDKSWFKFFFKIWTYQWRLVRYVSETDGGGHAAAELRKEGVQACSVLYRWNRDLLERNGYRRQRIRSPWKITLKLLLSRILR